MPSLNTTNEYHSQDLKTLGWELTVCNALFPTDSPCRKILKSDDSYGCLLYFYLSCFLPMRLIKIVIEVGGGYGRLMRDFLRLRPDFKATMLDISPVLLEEQRKFIPSDAVNYVLGDFLDAELSFLSAFDLAILNENLGDFPTAVNVDSGILTSGASQLDPLLLKIRELFSLYDFPMPSGESFNFNLGAVSAVEKLCSASVPYIFLAEHSCESEAPEHLAKYLDIRPSGNPERIALKGHDEYTIKFSHLARVAHHYNYHAIRGQMADYVEPLTPDRLKTIMRSNFSANDEHEIIRQFIYDLYKYEYLILIRKDEDV